MTKKKEQPTPAHYEVMRGIEGEDWRFEVGEIISPDDVDFDMITHWLSTGVLKRMNYGNR